MPRAEKPGRGMNPKDATQGGTAETDAVEREDQVQFAQQPDDGTHRGGQQSPERQAEKRDNVETHMQHAEPESDRDDT